MRSIESNVLVDDGDIVVLGGLLQDDYSGEPAKRCRGSATCRCSATCSKRYARAQEDQPDGVPAPGGGARRAPKPMRLSLDRYDLMRGVQQSAQPTHSVTVPVNQAPVMAPASLLQPAGRYRRPAGTGPVGTGAVHRRRHPHDATASSVTGAPTSPRLQCAPARRSPGDPRRPSPTHASGDHALPAALRLRAQPPAAAGGRRTGRCTLWHTGQPDPRRAGRSACANTRCARCSRPMRRRAGAAHQRGLCAGRIERRHGGERGARATPTSRA